MVLSAAGDRAGWRSALSSFADRIGRLDQADHAPLYRQLQRVLRDAITNQVLSPEDALPAERDLAHELAEHGRFVALADQRIENRRFDKSGMDRIAANATRSLACEREGGRTPYSLRCSGDQRYPAGGGQTWNITSDRIPDGESVSIKP